MLYQSQRSASYQAALAGLRHVLVRLHAARDCRLVARPRSRRRADLPRHLPRGLAAGKTPRALRLRTGSEEIAFTDRVQGPQRQVLEREIGDFVLLRADGQFAYQLAVVVDDAEQGVTDVVRGADLLDSTPRQIYLQRSSAIPRRGTCMCRPR